ncbi:hypothetical protein [Nafulsella turpanensis]|uniref:hypothetical protein n=1 Tax=Nafulsella turpanensis TaxID=1265690 RepID=UPI0003756330|nr:hypothetical protein [Nafulsella turpanensis]
MNKKFLPVWVIFAAGLIYSGVKIYNSYSEDVGLLIGTCGLFGVFMIFEILRKHKDFSLSNGDLIVRQTLRREKIIKLKSLKSWTEDAFYYPGHSKRTLILETTDGQKMSLSDKDDEMEFEKLYHQLKVKHGQIKR